MTSPDTRPDAALSSDDRVRTGAFRRPETDRDAAPQFVLPMVVRIEKAAPPARTDALETAARAVLVLLSDERTTAPDGEWAEAVRSWQDARIRKVVRRARGAEWRRAEALPGITVGGRAAGDGGPPAAQVRVFPPVPLDGWPTRWSTPAWTRRPVNLSPPRVWPNALAGVPS